MNGFSLDKKEQIKANDWINKQLKEKPKEVGAIGGRFTYSFTPTNLGTIISINDNSTHESLDLTDYSSW